MQNDYLKNEAKQIEKDKGKNLKNRLQNDFGKEIEELEKMQNFAQSRKRKTKFSVLK